MVSSRFFFFHIYLFVCVFFVFLQSFCEPGNIAENGVLAFAKHVTFPILSGRGRSLSPPQLFLVPLFFFQGTFTITPVAMVTIVILAVVS